MQTRSAAAWVILIGVACASLLWASPRLFDPVFLPSASRPTSWASDGGDPYPRARLAHDARSSGRTGVALPSMPVASVALSSYSLSAPKFISDPAAAAAQSIAVGDVSGDGLDDLVFLSLREESNPWNSRLEVYVAYQRADGLLDAAVKIAESDNFLAYQLLVADLDFDGASDIITVTFDGVMVLRSNRDGTFVQSTAVVNDPLGMVVTDVDRDGHLDILVDSSNTAATIVHGDGRGGVDHVSTISLPSAAVRTTGDVTGDGLDDLILAVVFNRPLEEFRIYPALATGGYAAPVLLSFPLGSNQPASLAVGDFNADGRGDLALDEAKDDASLRLYFQDPQGSLSSSIAIPRVRGSSTFSLIASDLDRDGRSDLAIAHSGWGYVGHYLQTSAGFSSEIVTNAYQSHGRYNYFSTGDLNHDGCGDLVISRWSESPVLLYGQGCVRRHTANCRLPPQPVGSSAVPLTPLQNGNEGVNVRRDLHRGAAIRFERNRPGVDVAPSPMSVPVPRAGVSSVDL